MISSEQWLLDEPDNLVPLDKWQKTISVMARVFNAPAGFLVQYTPDGYQVVLSCGQDSNPYPAGGVIPPDTNIFCRKIIESNAGLYVRDARSDRQWDTNPEVANDGFVSYFGLPVHWPDGKAFGTICVMDFKDTDYHDEFLDLLSELRDLIECDLELVERFQSMSDYAFHDQLTGLNNRRSFLLAAGHRLALARRAKDALGLIFVDMDGLKQINDQQGHKQGDAALQSLATAIESTAREADVAARIGGDEFVILANCATDAELEKFVERLEQSFQRAGVSASIGHVLIQEPEKDIEFWIEGADRCMYEAKKSKHS